jgi:hypothetical protein
MKTLIHTAYFEYGFEIEMKTDDIISATKPGPVDETIAAMLEEEFYSAQLDAIPADKIRSELSEYGAWDDDELKDDDQNRARILWIAAGNIKDEMSC